VDEMKIREYGPLSLAYLGDAVFELMVREMLVSSGREGNGALHCEAKNYVSAKAQRSFVEKLLPILTQEEAAAFRRGRNANVSVPKSASPDEYHKATGLESLFGYLYLLGKKERLAELFAIITAKEE